MLFLFVVALVSSCAKNKSPGAPHGNSLAQFSPAELHTIRTSLLSGYGMRLAADPGKELNCRDITAQLPDFRSGVVEVPEDWSRPEASSKIKVFYYWRPAPRGKENRAPVVFFNGGPTQPSFSSAMALAPLEYTSRQAFVFIDQRGTGCSTHFPKGRDEATMLRLAHWGSESIVKDAETVRRKLFGNTRWRVFGQSYGGLIGHRYAEVAPEGVDRLIVHGYAYMRNSNLWLAERLAAQKRAADRFFKRYPQDRQLLQLAREGIGPNRCWEQNHSKICGPGVLDSLVLLLGVQLTWGELHSLIGELTVKGKLHEPTLERTIQRLIFAQLLAADLGGSVLSVLEVTPGLITTHACPEAENLLRARGEKPEAFELSECRLVATLADDGSDKMLKKIAPRPISLEKIKANLEKHGFPFFLFSGELDSFVPAETFNEEAEFLGRHIRYHSFPESGHEGFYTEPDVAAAVVE